MTGSPVWILNFYNSNKYTTSIAALLNANNVMTLRNAVAAGNTASKLDTSKAIFSSVYLFENFTSEYRTNTLKIPKSKTECSSFRHSPRPRADCPRSSSFDFSSVRLHSIRHGDPLDPINQWSWISYSWSQLWRNSWEANHGQDLGSSRRTSACSESQSQQANLLTAPSSIWKFWLMRFTWVFQNCRKRAILYDILQITLCWSR